MNTDHKKSVLGDDAFLYQQSHDTVSKEELKNMNFKQKLQYFKDYYMKKVIVVLIIIIAAISILNETVFNRSDCALFIACINDCMINKSEDMTTALTDYIQPEDKNDYVNISYYDLEDYNTNMAFVTHSTTGSIDLFIASSEFFEEKAALGMFADLSEVLPAEIYEQLSDKLIEGRTAETDIDGNIVSYGEYTPYGIDLSGNEKLAEYETIGKNPILCVSVTTENMDNVIKGLTYLLDLE